LQKLQSHLQLLRLQNGCKTLPVAHRSNAEGAGPFRRTGAPIMRTIESTAFTAATFLAAVLVVGTYIVA